MIDLSSVRGRNNTLLKPDIYHGPECGMRCWRFVSRISEMSQLYKSKKQSRDDLWVLEPKLYFLLREFSAGMRRVPLRPAE